MFETQQPVRFHDVDAAGLVYFPHFLHLCHVTMEDFLSTHGPCTYAQLITQRRRGFPAVHVEADYRAPLRFGDVATISLEVLQLGRSSVHFGYTIRRGGDVAFKGRIVTAYMDLDAAKAVPLDDAMRACLAPHLAQATSG